MPHALILEFEGADTDLYFQVGKLIDVGPNGEGNSPEGLISHTAASPRPEALTVFEIWETQAAQEKFMADRLGPALAEVGVPAPTRVEWMDVLGYHTH